MTHHKHTQGIDMRLDGRAGSLQSGYVVQTAPTNPKKEETDHE